MGSAETAAFASEEVIFTKEYPGVKARNIFMFVVLYEKVDNPVFKKFIEYCSSTIHGFDVLSRKGIDTSRYSLSEKVLKIQVFKLQ